MANVPLTDRPRQEYDTLFNTCNIRADKPKEVESLVGQIAAGEIPGARELQAFLNRMPGIFVKVDGNRGERTSDALKRAIGRHLSAIRLGMTDGRAAQAARGTSNEAYETVERKGGLLWARRLC